MTRLLGTEVTNFSDHVPAIGHPSLSMSKALQTGVVGFPYRRGFETGCRTQWQLSLGDNADGQTDSRLISTKSRHFVIFFPEWDKELYRRGEGINH